MAASSILFAAYHDYMIIFLAVGVLFLTLLPLSMKTIRPEPALQGAASG
jgi:hypothetical protein